MVEQNSVALVGPKVMTQKQCFFLFGAKKARFYISIFALELDGNLDGC